jgi:hypothetical protein
METINRNALQFKRRTDVFETSIGSVEVSASARDQIYVKTPEQHCAEGKLCIHLWLAPEGAEWTPECEPLFYEGYTPASAPNEVAKELTALGNKWAQAHPEEFEAALRRDQSVDLVGVKNDLGALQKSIEIEAENIRATIEEFELGENNQARTLLTECCHMLRAFAAQIQGRREMLVSITI